MDISKAIEGTYGTMYYVADMEKSVRYFKDIFNLQPATESPGWTEFKLGDHSLCLHATGPDGNVDGKGILITKVKGLKEVVATLKSRGVEFVNEIHSVCEGGYSVDFRDPSGNLMSLFEYTGE